MSKLSPPAIAVYTDGSSHTQLKVGAWVAIVFLADKKVVLSGTEACTTHNRMELTAVIRAIDYIRTQPVKMDGIYFYTDSQYVAGLPARQIQLMLDKLADSTGGAVTNASLVKEFYEKLHGLPISFVKVKAHQKRNRIPNYNIDADLLSRKILRAAVGRPIA